MAERLAMPVKEFAEALGVTRNTVFNWIKKGELRSVKIGGTRLVDVREFHSRMGTEKPKLDHLNKVANRGYERGSRENGAVND